MRRLGPALLLLLSACGTLGHPPVDMVGDFGNAVRWSDWDAAWKYLDPATIRRCGDADAHTKGQFARCDAPTGFRVPSP